MAPGLNSLPAELLGKIAENLCICRSCAGEPPFRPRCDWPTNNRCFPMCTHCRCHMQPAETDPREHIRNLLALSLTSRTIRAGVIQYLYHRPDVTQKWWLLARTALENPKLASCVRELHFPSEWEFKYPKSLDDIPEKVLTYYRTGLVSAFNSTNFNDIPRDPDALITTNTDDEVSLLASLFPQLRRIEAVVGYAEFEDDVKMFHFSRAGSLPLLESVELVYHGDMDGISWEPLTRYLFRAAPNLASLRVYALRDEPEDIDEWEEEDNNNNNNLPANQGDNDTPDTAVAAADPPLVILEKLRYLDLRHSCISMRQLQLILATCPNLRTFIYQCGGTKTGPSQFHEIELAGVMLRQHRARGGSSLQNVVVDLQYALEQGMDYYIVNEVFDEAERDEWNRDIRRRFKRRGINLSVFRPIELPW